MSNNTLTNAIKELKWIYWIFPGIFFAGMIAEIVLYQMGDVAPMSAVALTAFWALFAYVAQTMVLRRAIRTLEAQV